MGEQLSLFPDQAESGRTYVSAPVSNEMGGLGQSTRPSVLSISTAIFVWLIGLAIAELVTVHVDAGWGAFCHASLAGAALALAAQVARKESIEGHALVGSRRLEANLFVALSLPSLLRLVTLAVPREDLSFSEAGGVVTLCLFAATFTAARASGYSWRGFVLPARSASPPYLFTLMVAYSGVIIGYLEFRILKPAGLIDRLSLSQLAIMTIVVLFLAGVGVELMLRGLLQVAVTSLFGSGAGIVVVAIVFAIMQLGYQSWTEVTFAFLAAIWLGFTVQITGSVVGAALAHGIANVCVFVAFPLLLQ